jgi:hypothetical protein
MPRKMKTIAIANSFFSCPIFGINMCTRSRCACLLLRACTDVLFSSFFLLCFLTHPLLFFVLFVWRLLNQTKSHTKLIFCLSHFATPLNANARERYPFVVRCYWQQKAKSKVRFFIAVSLFRRFIQSTAGRREKERERERKRSSFCVRCFSCCAQRRFFLFPENLSSFLFFFVFFFRSARRLNAMRERERERIIDS